MEAVKFNFPIQICDLRCIKSHLWSRFVQNLHRVYPLNAFIEFLHHIHMAIKHEPLGGCKAAITNSTHYSRFKYWFLKTENTWKLKRPN